MTARPITAVIVDDSAIVRTHLSQLLTAGGIEVLATAGDPLFAWPKLQARWPDVIVLDVEMPRMDGITFLRKLMAERPTPVVMCSTLTAAGASTTMEALAVGAVAFVTKPKLGLRDFLSDSANGLVAAVRAAASARVRAAPAAGGPALPGTVTAHSADATAAIRPSGAASAAVDHEGSGGSGGSCVSGPGALHETTERVIAIGASTGGVQAIEQVLRGLPSTTPGVVIVQHMPESFTAAFAARLNGLCEMEVREARDGDRVMPGRVLIAPGGQHMQLVRSGAQYQVSVRNGPLVNRHKPSVDVLFKSVAQHAGRNASGVILTGMGDDGARGLLDMRQAGAHTAAQDEASCVVYGMPREAVRINGASLSLPLGQVAAWLLHTVKQAGGVPVS